jgi:membrane-associated phospholipid phosphatase
LSSYAPLPWLRSRPPRALEASLAAHPFFRRLNTAILDNASVQANTLPSGHVSGAVAAAFGILTVNVTAGWAVMIVAGVIAIAAIAGRYHYVVDCVAGAAVAAAVWSVM